MYRKININTLCFLGWSPLIRTYNVSETLLVAHAVMGHSSYYLDHPREKIWAPSHSVRSTSM